MRIDHLAIHVRDLEGAAQFFKEFFGAEIDETYHNPKTGLRSNFLKLDEGPRFEIMTRPGLVDASSTTMSCGYTHMAFALGSEKAVDELTERLRSGGYEILSGPRVTGDGYYETSLLGWEGINIEITV